MMMKPIRTEADYEAAVERLGELMSTPESVLDVDELDLLSTLIEAYEEERFPVEAPTPLAAIKFRMEQEGLSPRDLEPYIGTRARVSEILSGERSLSIDMIRSLNKHLGIPAQSLIRPEPPSENISIMKPSLSVLNLLKKWRLLDHGETYEGFFLRACGSVPANAMLRKTRSERTNAKSDPAALNAWCASVMLLSRQRETRCKFSAGAITLDVAREVASLSRRENGMAAVSKELANLGIIFVVLPHLPETYLDGAALLREDSTPIVAMTLRHDRADNFWFTLLHELAHVHKHLSMETQAIFDDLDLKSFDALEKEADDLAQEALIPKEIWDNAALDAYASTAKIISLARKANVDPAVVAGRWQREFRDFRKFSRLLGRGTPKSIFANSLPE